MPHLISNLYEKAYTPFTARLAPRNLWSKPQLGKPLTVSVILYRQETTESRKIWIRPNCQGHLEINQDMGYSEPQGLLHLRSHQ